MKQTTCKGLEPAPSSAITEEQLEQINRYTRRTLGREEVFVFSLVLCDNEVDRDFDRFPVASLQVLAKLFPGKTGVFDHTPRAENQSARIFSATLEQTGETTTLGEPYCHLKAWAYMVRCDKNADLILEIDAGIKKEVSIGCAVEQVQCSVCGAEGSACAHQKGKRYDGALCHHLLLRPSDAYEWSFVAVPAQARAGVVKRRSGAGIPPAAPAADRGYAPPAGMVLLEKACLAQLEQQAELGRRYEEDLRAEVVRLGLLGQPELAADTLAQITARLDTGQLQALQKSFAAAARTRYPVAPQLWREAQPGEDRGEAFRI